MQRKQGGFRKTLYVIVSKTLTKTKHTKKAKSNKKLNTQKRVE